MAAIQMLSPMKKPDEVSGEMHRNAVNTAERWSGFFVALRRTSPVNHPQLPSSTSHARTHRHTPHGSVLVGQQHHNTDQPTLPGQRTVSHW
jgi:hypothetical protein